MRRNTIITDDINYSTITLRPDWRQFIADEFWTLLFAIAMYIIGGLDSISFSSIFFCIGLALTFLMYYRYVYLRGMRYTITDQQLVYEHGVFSRSRDFVELYRIVDYDERRSFLQMILGLKTIIIHSGDRTTPNLKIVGVRERTEIVNTLRERVAFNRSRMNIHEFANYI